MVIKHNVFICACEVIEPITFKLLIRYTSILLAHKIYEIDIKTGKAHLEFLKQMHIFGIYFSFHNIQKFY